MAVLGAWIMAAWAAVAATPKPAEARKRAACVRAAERYESEGRFGKAAARYGKAIRYPAPDGADQARLLLKRADCLNLAGKYRLAAEVYMDLLKSYSFHAPFEQVLGQLRDLAGRFASGDISTFGFNDTGFAASIYEFILAKAPADVQAPTDMLRLARLQRDAGQSEEGVLTLEQLLQKYPLAPEEADARIELARLLFELGRDGDGDGRLVRRATRELQAFVQKHPEHERRAEADLLLSIAEERQGRNLLELGKFYLRPAHHRRGAARRYLNDVIRQFPDTTAAVLARIQLAAIEAEPEPAPEAEATAPPVSSSTPAPEADPGEEAAVSAAVPAARPAKRAASSATLRSRDTVGKWLLPLEELSDAAGETPDE